MHILRRYALPGAALVLVLAVNACSGSDDDPESGGSESSATADENGSGAAEAGSEEGEAGSEEGEAGSEEGETSGDEGETGSEEGETGGDEGGSSDKPAGTAAVPETCPDDVIDALTGLADGAAINNIGPDETDPDLFCSFFAGEQNSESIAVIVSTDEPADWSSLGPVNTTEVTVAGFAGELADLVGAGQALVVDVDGVYITVNVGKDADLAEDDLMALADTSVRSILE